MGEKKFFTLSADLLMHKIDYVNRSRHMFALNVEQMQVASNVTRTVCILRSQQARHGASVYLGFLEEYVVAIE